MPDEVSAQTAVLEPPQTAVPEAQAMTAVPAGVEAAAAGEGGAASTPVTFDLSSEDGIKAALEAHPSLQTFIKRERDNGFNSGRQTRDAELRREQGSVERAQAYQQLLAEKYGVELDPDDQRNLPLFVKANEDWARVQMNHAYAKAVLDRFGIEESEPIKAALTAVSDDPAATTALASQLIEAIESKAKANGLDTLPEDQLATHPRLKTFIDSEVQRLLAEELRAREVEANRLEVSPEAPLGSVGAPGMTKERFNNMTPDARKAWLLESDANREAAWAFV